MTKFQLRIAAIVPFCSFAVTSGSFASTHDDIAVSKNVAHGIDTTADSTLPLFSGSAAASVCDMNEAAVESTEIVDSFPGASIIDPDDPEAAALNWLENEMQMSIDPSGEPQGYTAGWSCTRPPFNCPTYQSCYGSVCKINECGEGKCSFCPVNPPFRIVKSWCTYTCMKGPNVVGSAFGFRLAADLWWGPTCL